MEQNQVLLKMEYRHTFLTLWDIVTGLFNYATKTQEVT